MTLYTILDLAHKRLS